MARDTAHTAQQKKNMLVALTATLGVVETACQKAGVGRRTHYDWLKEDTEYAADVREINDISLDFAESQLLKVIRGYTMPDVKVFMNKEDPDNPIIVPITKHIGTDVAATIFYLKTKGKARGYVERQQIEQVAPADTADLLTDDQLEDEIKRLLGQ